MATEATITLPEAGPAGATETAPPNPMQVDEMFSGLDAAIQKDKEAAGVPKDTDAPKTEPKPDAKTESTPKTDEAPKLKLGEKKEEPKQEEQVQWDEKAAVPRSRADWDKFREARNREVATLSEKIKTYESRLSELEPKAADLGAVEELKAKVAQYEQQMQESAVLNDPALTADLDARLKHALAPVKATFDDKVSAEFEAIAQLPPSKHREKMFGELVEDLPAWQQAKLASVLATTDMLNGERGERLSNAKANAAQYLQQKAQALEAQKAQVQRQNNLMFDSVVGELKQKPGFADVFKDDGFAKQWVEGARNVFQGGVGDAKTLAHKSLMAEIAQPLMAYAIEQTNSAQAALAKVAQLEAELKKYADSSPKPSTATTTAGPAGDDPFLDGLLKAFNS